MEKWKWLLQPIENHVHDIKMLFELNRGHKHEENYIQRPLFEYTKFARMGWQSQYFYKNRIKWNLVYYSAGIERPEYNGGIRIMSRHTRDTSINWGSKSEELRRGLSTLGHLTKVALDMGYKDIWVSREENPALLKYFQSHSFYNWNLSHEDIPKGGLQWVLRLA